MGNKKRHARSQSISEYSILVAVVILACAAMFIYTQRGLQARYHDVVRAAQKAGGVAQYEPIATKAQTNYTFRSQGFEKAFPQGAERARHMDSFINASVNQNEAIVNQTLVTR